MIIIKLIWILLIKVTNLYEYFFYKAKFVNLIFIILDKLITIIN